MKDLAWEERYAWYHYSYHEIFEYSDEDFENDAKAYAERGVTTVLTFSGTHFTYTFEPFWESIFACIGRIVRAFHKYGIKVVEHRSYALSARNAAEETWKDHPNFYDYASWPGLKERIFSDYTVCGVPISQLSQVDGRTGEPMITYYQAHCFCANNPECRRIALYFAGRVMDEGVDGMMNDDVQYFPNACACRYCREKFRSETGFELPGPEGWEAFYENYDDPAYVEWKRFKVRSTSGLISAIVELEREKGLKLLRPCYISNILDGNWSCGYVEECRRYWTNYFQENCAPIVIRYGYQNFMMEAVDRYARSERLGIPSMSLFYPYTPALTYFAWALSRTWGQMYTGTLVHTDISETERPYYEFQKDHIDFYGPSEKCADLAFFESVRTREGRPPRESQSLRSMLTAANFSGLLADLVYEEDSPQRFSAYPRIVLTGASMLSDGDLEKLRTYAERGGKLLVVGPCGSLTERSERRTPGEVARALGLTAEIAPCGERKTGVFSLRGSSVEFPDLRTRSRFLASGGVLTSGDDVLGVSQRVGDGEVTWLLPELDDAPVDNTPFEKFPRILYTDRDKPHPDVEPSVIPQLRATTGAMLRAFVGEPNLTAACGSDDLLVSMFRGKAGRVIHLANISETFCTRAGKAWHDDPILGFDGGYRIPQPVELSFSMPSGGTPRCTLFSPEFSGGLELSPEREGDRLRLTVPADTFGGYAMIEIRDGSDG